ncbi:hypothetical protein GGS23DRAFT_586081 [Durotheca rogersii]|uniref:uncharacterized protein n=1 Tax=Durotheca rogersii TaxID=419775 RepID=UPI00221E5EF3|nr:uncharacterized protein GGS23DRAFT_586081 [Durotheca rogersii]KAI5859355.1 hypothetical protein GGS23DRAFT_586081 [Durotheca rogersii]
MATANRKVPVKSSITYHIEPTTLCRYALQAVVVVMLLLLNDIEDIAAEPPRRNQLGNNTPKTADSSAQNPVPLGGGGGGHFTLHNMHDHFPKAVPAASPVVLGGIEPVSGAESGWEKASEKRSSSFQLQTELTRTPVGAIRLFGASPSTPHPPSPPFFGERR